MWHKDTWSTRLRYAWAISPPPALTTSTTPTEQRMAVTSCQLIREEKVGDPGVTLWWDITADSSSTATASGIRRRDNQGGRGAKRMLIGNYRGRKWSSRMTKVLLVLMISPLLYCKPIVSGCYEQEMKLQEALWQHINIMLISTKRSLMDRYAWHSADTCVHCVVLR